MEASEIVISTLTTSGKPLRAGEIAEIAGANKKEIEKAIKKLTAEGILYSPVRCFYDINK